MTAPLEPLKESRMRQIVCFAYEHSRFYRQLYETNHINPETVNLPGGLPTVSQLDLVESSLLFRTNIPSFKVCASSGTSGKPKLMFRTEADFEKSVNNQIQLMQWSDVKSDDIVAIIQPFGLWGYGDLTQEATRRMEALALPIGTVSDEVALNLIETIGATVLDISPSRLRNLLHLSQKTANSNRIKLNAIMLAGEPIPTGLPEQARKLWGAKVFNHYGSEETDALGGNRVCGGPISLFDSDFVFEFLEEDETPSRKGELGQIVVTSLYHKGTPLIRYKLQDLVRQHQTSANGIEILGKAGEYVILHDSVKLYPYQIDYALQRLAHSINGWQCVIQNREDKVWATFNLHIYDDSISCQQVQVALSKCNIDVEALVANGDLRFDVVLGEPFISTQRGKTRRFIDRRNS